MHRHTSPQPAKRDEGLKDAKILLCQPVSRACYCGPFPSSVRDYFVVQSAFLCGSPTCGWPSVDVGGNPYFSVLKSSDVRKTCWATVKIDVLLGHGSSLGIQEMHQLGDRLFLFCFLFNR